MKNIPLERAADLEDENTSCWIFLHQKSPAMNTEDGSLRGLDHSRLLSYVRLSYIVVKLSYIVRGAVPGSSVCG